MAAEIKNVLVLGASGFIAGHMIEFLLAEGCCVYTASNKPLSRPFVTHHSIGDLTDRSFVESVFAKKQFDEVFCFATHTGGATYMNSKIHDADIMSQSVLINVHVAQCCVKYKAKKLFFPSSACVYPSHSLGRETDAYPVQCDNNYSFEKLFSERMYQSFKVQYGLNVKIARFDSIVGEYAAFRGGREKAHAELARKVAMANDGDTIDIIGNGEQVRTFLYVKDCVAAVRIMMDSDCDEIVNIGSEEPITIHDYVHLLMDISNKILHINHVPGHTGVQERRCDITKMKKLGWSPTTSLRNATQKTFDWINSELHQ